ncbi:hypothetical protein NQ315_001593 [Exocentrus adspersus]|uniref:Uncharacterized protein n=1 Tax=Exocentrus adspersus TaxID=1586481 RepID=A0AAV8WAF1_9CUCU|nr:hypothetical protein NQ315_001593 [Exocentrus adspersus]
MFSTELSSDFRQLLDSVKPGFEANLIRAFKNEAVRNQQKTNNNRYIHKMDNILFSVGDTKIELSNLKFPWIPDFRIINMSADFSMLCLDVSLKLGDLRVEGDYETNNLTLQKLLPISNNGKIAVVFRDVTAKGRIGLLIKGDSLVPENYDIKYESAETAITVKYYISSENEIENKINVQHGDTIGGTIWVQLYDILTRLLHLQLAEVVVEFSLTELLIDEDEQLRELAREHSQRANKLLDSLLCTAKDYLVAMNYRSIETPAINVVYRGKLTGVHQGKLTTKEGYIQDLSTLSRLHDLSLYEDRQNLVVYGSLTLREFKHGYDYYSSQFEDTRIEGNIKASVYKNNISIKLTVVKEAERCKTQLETIKLTTIRDIDVDASGLASLTWLSPKLESWVIGHLRHNAVPVLEKYITEAFQQAIDETDCVSLLVD